MSYYKETFKYKLSNHARTRLNERTHLKGSPDNIILYWVERTIEDSVVAERTINGDVTYINHQEQIKMVVTKNNLVKTVINLKQKNNYRR